MVINMAKRVKKVSKLLLIFISLASLLLGLLIGATSNYIETRPISDIIINDDLKIHFLELGNDNSGDCILIQAGEYDVLVDAGSKLNSYSTIKGYLDNYIQDDKIEYVIVTHAHEDHYANFAGNRSTSLLTDYKIDNLIKFSKTNQTTGKMYQNFNSIVNKIKNEGTKIYTALECYNNENGCSRSLELTSSINLEILYNYYYEHDSSTENNYSICFMLNQGDRHFLFTGGL